MATSWPADAARPSAASKGPGSKIVAHDDEHPRARGPQDRAIDGAREIGARLAARDVDLAQQVERAAASAQRFVDPHQAVAGDDDLRALARRERHVADRRGESLGHDELGRLARVERSARVHDEPHDDVLLGAEQLEDGLPGPRERQPVDAAQIVARRVGPVLEELGAAAATAPRRARRRRPELRADRQAPAQRLELPGERGIEQSAHGRRRASLGAQRGLGGGDRGVVLAHHAPAPVRGGAEEHHPETCPT